MKDHSVEGFIGGVILTCFITIPWVSISDPEIIASIDDSGCASHQPPAPEHKTNIESYNLDSLKGNK